MGKDYYKLLGVEKSAEDSELKKGASASNANQKNCRWVEPVPLVYNGARSELQY